MDIYIHDVEKFGYNLRTFSKDRMVTLQLKRCISNETNSITDEIVFCFDSIRDVLAFAAKIREMASLSENLLNHNETSNPIRE